MEYAQFDIEFTNKRIISASGLSVVGGILTKCSFVKQLNRIPMDQRKSGEPQIKNSDNILMKIGLLVHGNGDSQSICWRTVIEGIALCVSHVTKHAHHCIMGMNHSNVWR